MIYEINLPSLTVSGVDSLFSVGDTSGAKETDNTLTVCHLVSLVRVIFKSYENK